MAYNCIALSIGMRHGHSTYNPTNEKRWANDAGLMLAHGLRRWYNIKPIHFSNHLDY